MFVWLKVPAGDPMAIAKAALENGVAIVPSTVFYTLDAVNEGKVESAFRLSFSHANHEQLATAVERLKATF